MQRVLIWKGGLLNIKNISSTPNQGEREEAIVLEIQVTILYEVIIMNTYFQISWGCTRLIHPSKTKRFECTFEVCKQYVSVVITKR